MNIPFTIPPSAALTVSVMADSLPEGPARELMLAIARELGRGTSVRIDVPRVEHT